MPLPKTWMECLQSWISGLDTDLSPRVSVAAISLPSGAATSANQAAIEADIEAVATAVVAVGVELALKADLTETQPVSATALPLPTGAATSAAQVTMEAAIDAITTKLGTIETDIEATNTAIALLAELTETQPVSAAVLPLPTDAATSAKQLADGHNVAVTSLPDERATSTGLKAADHACKASAGTLMGVTMLPDGVNAFTLTIYDDPDSADGTVLFKNVIAGDAEPFIVAGLETKALTGIYADGSVAAGTFSYIALYR